MAMERRFIPACAGNAAPTAQRESGASVHPRMRGERFISNGRPPKATGSSPHARGTRVSVSYRRPGGRFIPACAGNASRGGPGVRRLAVHPRMRGERSEDWEPRHISDGSSPHARGTRSSSSTRDLDRGFIPACAGNASDANPACAVAAVHPRMRGERDRLRLDHGHGVGSSPHARGTHRRRS